MTDLRNAQYQGMRVASLILAKFSKISSPILMIIYQRGLPPEVGRCLLSFNIASTCV